MIAVRRSARGVIMHSSEFRHRLPSWLLLTAIGALPVLALAVFAYLLSARAVEQLVRANNDATAIITAEMMAREAEHWVSALLSHAESPGIASAVAAGDAPGLSARLATFVNANHHIDRAFVSDTSGLLWADYPPAPDSLGRNFSFRDWYRGVSSTGAPYISEVYRRSAEPQPPVVAIAAPVADPASGITTAFLVAQVQLGSLSQLLRKVEVGTDGIVLLIDHQGTLAAHPDLDLDLDNIMYRDYQHVPIQLRSAGQRPVSRGHFADPFSGAEVIASTAPVAIGGHEWTVISQQPVTAAFASTRMLALRLSAGGLLMTAFMGMLAWRLGRENTRRATAEQALRDMNERLELRIEERTRALREKEAELLRAQKLEAVGQLAGGIAHDFNNLLTVIIGSMELLLKRLPDGAVGHREAKLSFEAAGRAAKLTQQLLAFSRKQVMAPQAVNLNETLEEMRGILGGVLGARIETVWHLEPALHTVDFDPGQLDQVIMNLALNARDAMPQGGRLTISTKNLQLDDDFVAAHPDASPGEHVLLTITDTGTGMDQATLERIFEPFFTTKEFGRGTGLGLSSVYGIICQGGGTIQVSSRPGHGTTFRIYLPCASEADDS